MELLNKAKVIAQDVKLYWKKPPKGRYMTYKSIASLAVGGMGVKLIVTCVQAMILSVGNVLIGNVIGIPPTESYLIYVVSIIASFPLTALRANIIDNTKSTKGKYRPYILYMGLPTVILAIGFVWMPYELMSMAVKCTVILLFNIGFQFFYMFFYDVYDNYVNVLSPNTQERTDVYSIRAVLDSLAPSIIGIIMPIFAKMITGEDTLVDIRIYRYVYPPLLILGAIFAVIIYANTEEKIIQAKTHVIQIKFIDAIRAVAKNKYFWIISLAGWLGFLEASYGNILFWLYSYQESCSSGMYALITTVYGNASLWGMMIAPFAIRRFGKKKVLIFTNMLNIVFIAMLYPSIIIVPDPKVMIWLVLGCLWLNAVVGSFAHVLNPSLNGDIRDYQQYVTGERIDGMFATVGLIGSVFTLITSGVLPALYANGGINETMLAELTPNLIATGKIAADAAPNVYNVLYDTAIFEHTIGLLILASIAGAVMNVIPFFFYDLSEVKQRGIVNVLKIRAMFEDYGNDVLSNRKIVETLDLINDAEELYKEVPATITKDDIAQAKVTHDKTEIRKAKKAYRASIERNRTIEISKFVMEEMNRFSTPEGIASLESAHEVFNAGLKNLVNVDSNVIKIAKALPNDSEREKLHRKTEITNAVESIRAKKTIHKYYSNGIVEYDMTLLDSLFEKEDNNLEAMNADLQIIIEADKNKDKAAATAARAHIKLLRKEKAEIKKQIKVAADERAIYYRAAKPYIKAKALIAQAENYRDFEKIADKYNEAKDHVEADDLAKAEEERLLLEEKEALANAVKAEKAEKKLAKVTSKDSKETKTSKDSKSTKTTKSSKDTKTTKAKKDATGTKAKKDTKTAKEKKDNNQKKD